MAVNDDQYISHTSLLLACSRRCLCCGVDQMNGMTQQSAVITNVCRSPVIASELSVAGLRRSPAAVIQSHSVNTHAVDATTSVTGLGNYTCDTGLGNYTCVTGLGNYTCVAGLGNLHLLAIVLD